MHKVFRYKSGFLHIPFPLSSCILYFYVCEHLKFLGIHAFGVGGN